MKVSIIVPDGTVVVDGVGAVVPMPELVGIVRAVQWGWNGQKGHVEMLDGTNIGLDAEGFAEYQPYVDAHAAITAPPPPTLAELKVSRRKHFNERRESRFSEGVAFSGKIIDTDPASVLKINGAVTMALIAKVSSAPFSIDWTCSDDTSITLDGAGMIGLGVTVGQYADLLHQRTRTAKAELDAAATVAEVNAVVW